MAVLGLDWGARFVGFATASPDGLVITPRGFFERKIPKEKTWELFEKDRKELKKIISEWEIETIIIGLSLTHSSHTDELLVKASNLKETLTKEFALPVSLVDEYLTSWEANKSPHNQHAQAAALILKNYFHEQKPNYERKK
jgi:putative Holliday junction resolvase